MATALPRLGHVQAAMADMLCAYLRSLGHEMRQLQAEPGPFQWSALVLTTGQRGNQLCHERALERLLAQTYLQMAQCPRFVQGENSQPITVRVLQRRTGHDADASPGGNEMRDGSIA